MLESVKIENFKGFASHKIPLREISIIVGKNNAGKSTFVEALRLITLITNRSRTVTYRGVPKWINDLPISYKGITPSMKNLEISGPSIFHRYATESPSKITAQFTDGSLVTIYLGGKDKIYGVIKDPSGKVVKDKKHAQDLNIDTISILPQVAPVRASEVILSTDYVKSNISSSLAPLHFRNQLKLFPTEVFEQYREAIENTWHGVRIVELINERNFPGEPIYLEVQVDDFVSEVSEVGHGLQMWLQIMWFLTHSSASETIILDEPDVYLHADLQRKLIRFLKKRNSQIIMTTHSVEIMSEVEPDKILVIDKKRQKSKYANTFPVVQSLVDQIGSAQNIHMARLWNARRLILVEGKDVKFLKYFQNILFPESQESFEAIPNMALGGWGGWNYAIGTAMLLKNSLDEQILAYCLFDSDYHPLRHIETRYSEAVKKGIQLHIWAQKEIENYLLQATTLQRLITKRIASRTTPPTVEEISTKIKGLSLSMEDEIFDAISEEQLNLNKSRGHGNANKEARKIISHVKEETGDLLALASGKALISKFSLWSQQEFGISASPIAILQEMKAEEVADEVKMVITAIEKCEPFERE